MDLIGLYPMWYEPGIGSGWVVGFIATIHVLFSHVSVGAAVFFMVLATIAYRQNRPELLEFIKKYGLFLLVFSYILGSITGPGIWYSTTVASPRGISSLIHSFVWKWATEWVFFVIEVVGVYMVTYLVGKVDQKTHLRLTILLGLASYTTMLIILGILSFMMWPGKEEWFSEGGYLLGFYGGNTFAQLAMRTAFMFAMTAVVGSIVTAGFKDQVFRALINRWLAGFGIAGTVIGAALFYWYLNTLPEYSHLIMENRLPAWFAPSLYSILAGMLVYFLMMLATPRVITTWVASTATVALVVFGLWPEEVARESIRKPYVSGQYVYSNQLIARDVPGMNIKSEIPVVEEHGLLKTQVFMPDHLKTVTADNILQVGQALTTQMCSNCHSLSKTGIRPIGRYIGDNTDIPAIKTYLQAALSTGNTLYMPRIPLKDDEAEAIAVYLSYLNNQTVAQSYIAHKGALAQAAIKE
ncbi:MAG: cytochrome ubiquinol oxidase subunit I [Pseudomonadota bacterium]